MITLTDFDGNPFDYCYTRDEVIAMFTELLEEFENLDPSYDCNTYYAALCDCGNLTQQKINKLREGEL